MLEGGGDFCEKGETWTNLCIHGGGKGTCATWLPEGSWTVKAEDELNVFAVSETLQERMDVETH